MKIYEILELSLYLVLGSGIGTFITQKYFEHRLEKKLYRFNKLYTDKLEIIKNLYRLLIQAEKALDKLLSQREPDELEEKDNFRKTTMVKMDSFIEYFEENEIVFENSIIEIVSQISDKFNKAKSTHVFANMMENNRGSKAWEKAIEKKNNLHETLVKNEMPILKEKLKIEFQNKYRLLDK